jgi:hypothetical protein
MNRDEFLSYVYSQLVVDPSLFSDIVLVSQKALIDRTKIESSLRSEAWIALLAAYPYIGKRKKLKKSDTELINRIVLKASEGTEFGKKLREKLNNG